MSVESPLSSSRNAHITVSAMPTERVLGDLRALLGGHTTPWLDGWRPASRFTNAGGNVRATRLWLGWYADVAIDHVGEEPLQAARWAAVHTYAAQRRGTDPVRLILGPYHTDRDSGPTRTRLDLSRLSGAMALQGISRATLAGEGVHEAHLAVQATSLRAGLHQVAHNYSSLFPYIQQDSSQVAASIIGAPSFAVAERAFDLAAQQVSPLQAAQTMLAALIQNQEP